MRRRIGPLIASTATAALLGLLTASCADSFFYRPNDTRYDADTGEAHAEDVWFSAPGGPRLHGRWLRAGGEPAGTVVFCHGNHANLTLHARYASWLTTHGFDVLLFDYRGYGRSEGSPSRAGTLADTLAALDLALATDPDRTVAFGHSLGGALAIVAAAERPAVRAVVAEAAFASYRGVACDTVPWLAWLVPLLVPRGLDPIDAVGALAPRPLLIVHGARDRIVPVEHAHELFERAGAPKHLHVVASAGHATPWLVEGREFEELVAGFFADALDR